MHVIPSEPIPFEEFDASFWRPGICSDFSQREKKRILAQAELMLRTHNQIGMCSAITYATYMVTGRRMLINDVGKLFPKFRRWRYVLHNFWVKSVWRQLRAHDLYWEELPVTLYFPAEAQARRRKFLRWLWKTI